MRHTQLIGAIRRVIEAIGSSGLQQALASGDPPDTEQLLDALRRYAIDAATFDRGERRVIELLGVAELDHSTMWARLLSGATPRAHYLDRVRFITHHLPRFVELLEETHGQADPDAGLQVVVIATDRRGMSPSKAVTVINAVSTLYRVCALLGDRPRDGLRLRHVDAGADAHFMFDGDLDVIDQVKLLIGAAYRWLTMFREEALAHRIELARDVLPTTAALADRRAQGRIRPSDADAIEREVLIGLLAFFDVGALIPELEEIARDPREVVAEVRHPSELPPRDPDAFDDIVDEITALPDAAEDPNSVTGPHVIDLRRSS